MVTLRVIHNKEQIMDDATAPVQAGLFVRIILPNGALDIMQTADGGISLQAQDGNLVFRAASSNWVQISIEPFVEHKRNA